MEIESGNCLAPAHFEKNTFLLALEKIEKPTIIRIASTDQVGVIGKFVIVMALISFHARVRLGERASPRISNCYQTIGRQHRAVNELPLQRVEKWLVFLPTYCF